MEIKFVTPIVEDWIYKNYVREWDDKSWCINTQRDWLWFLEDLDKESRKKLREYNQKLHKKKASACLRWLKTNSVNIFTSKDIKTLLTSKKEEYEVNFEILREIADNQMDEIRSGCNTGLIC